MATALAPATLHFEEAWHLYDTRAGEYLGGPSKGPFHVMLPVYEGALWTALKYQVSAVNVVQIDADDDADADAGYDSDGDALPSSSSSSPSSSPSSSSSSSSAAAAAAAAPSGRVGIQVTVQAQDGTTPGTHVLMLTASAADGTPIELLTKKVVAIGGVWEGVLAFGADYGPLAGSVVVVRDVGTGVNGTTALSSL
eukprot:COSAG06_NODE_15235_length_1087_cov_2.604251_1_plen_196_part_00